MYTLQIHLVEFYYRSTSQKEMKELPISCIGLLVALCYWEHVEEQFSCQGKWFRLLDVLITN